MVKKECLFEKKPFQLFKSLPWKNEKAQKLQLLTGRLVIYKITHNHVIQKR